MSEVEFVLVMSLIAFLFGVLAGLVMENRLLKVDAKRRLSKEAYEKFLYLLDEIGWL
jgi:hypothetical protein